MPLRNTSRKLVAVCFDEHGKTFRHEFFEEYKAGRRETPNELIQQFDMLKDALSKMGIAMLKKQGMEADDYLGAASKCAAKEGVHSFIVTGDRDALQLINDKTTVVLTKKGISETIETDEKTLKEMMGITPEQVVHLKALAGDSSDNIPGVAGVGDKTAVKLLDEYKTLDGIYEHIDEIKGKLKEKLINDKENAYLSLKLATINADFEKIDISSLAFAGINEAWEQVFDDFELKSLKNRLFAEEKKEFSVINREELLKLKKAALCLIGDKLVLSDGENDYLVNNEDICVLDIEEAIIHNSKETNTFIVANGGKYIAPEADTMLAEYVINPTRRDFDINTVLSAYTKANISSLFEIAQKQREKMLAEGLDFIYDKIEMPLSKVLFDMQQLGFKVDEKEIDELEKRFDERIEKLKKLIYEYAEEKFNINSTKELATILFEKIGLPAYKKTKRGYSTDASVLENLAGMHPIIAPLLEFRKISKLKSTYIDGIKPLIVDSRVHTTFKQEGTVTGRISSLEPNLQNIPVRTEEGREIRKMFIASEGNTLVSADYSQIELRILAHMSEDEEMIKAFLNNQDIHAATASQIFNVDKSEVTDDQRRAAKAVNFGIVYGISDFGLAKNLGITNKRAKEYIESYLNKFFGVKNYMDEVVERAKQTGKSETMFGRIREIAELKSSNYNVRSFGERAALNTPIQGTAADIIKIAMINVAKKLEEKNLKARLILQIHDELIIDTPLNEVDEVKNILMEEMTGAANLSVPLSVNVSEGANWFLAK